MYDQLGGGFARYSVDQFWMIPHFEKMLYDNGALLATLRRSGARHRRCAVQAHRARNRRVAAARNAGCLVRAGGGFYSAYDADSEGHEGKFYVWTREEVQRGADAARMAACSAAASASTRRRISKARGIAHVFVSIEQIAKELAARRRPKSRTPIDSARAKLLAIRSKRVWPGLDDKILTSWNALAIRGLAIAARVARKAGVRGRRRTRARLHARATCGTCRWRGPAAGHRARTASRI